MSPAAKGRNALFLASRGFQVTAIDISPVGLEHGRERAKANSLSITWQQADLEDLQVAAGEYDLIVNINYLQRSLMPRLKGALKPGGHVIFETYLIDQRAVGHPKNPDYLFDHNELLDQFRDFRVLLYREGKFAGWHGAVVSRRHPGAESRLTPTSIKCVIGQNRHVLRLDVEFRAMCHSCRRPRTGCYCALVAPFDSEPRFVILRQPREAKHRLGTGRMAHLCLSNSLLLEGVDFSRDERIDREIQNPSFFPVLLYPSEDATNLTRQTPAERLALVPTGRQLVVFLLDGTWKSVRKMLRLSRNVASLPTHMF